MKKELWRDVKVRIEAPVVPVLPEVSIKYRVPRFATALKVKQLMQEYFPAGPGAARDAYMAHRAWREENVFRFYTNENRPNEQAMQWKAFDDAYDKWATTERKRGVLHGKYLLDGVDFSRLDLRLRPKLLP
jgi:hypothetical protein